MNASLRSTIIIKGAYLYAEYMDARGPILQAVALQAFEQWAKNIGENEEAKRMVKHAKDIQEACMDYCIHNDF